MLDNNISI